MPRRPGFLTQDERDASLAVGRASFSCRPGGGDDEDTSSCCEFWSCPRGLEVWASCLCRALAVFCRTHSQTHRRNLVTCINYPRTATGVQGNHSENRGARGVRSGRDSTRRGWNLCSLRRGLETPCSEVDSDEHMTAGKGFPSKHTTLVPLLPKPKRKEHHSIFPPSVPNDTVGFQTLTGQGMDILPRILHARSSTSCLHPRLVMLERPPGGATMRWPVRRGLLSSIWAPGRDRASHSSEIC